MRELWHRDVLRETGVSAIANSLFSIAFVFVVFHGQPKIPIAGPGGLERDAFLQCFMVGLMSALIAPIVIRSRENAGKLGYELVHCFTGLFTLYVRAVCFAIAAMAAGVLVQAFLLTAIFPLSPNFRQALVFKALFGAGLALSVTPCALFSAFKQRQTPEPPESTD